MTTDTLFANRSSLGLMNILSHGGDIGPRRIDAQLNGLTARDQYCPNRDPRRLELTPQREKRLPQTVTGGFDIGVRPKPFHQLFPGMILTGKIHQITQQGGGFSSLETLDRLIVTPRRQLTKYSDLPERFQ